VVAATLVPGAVLAGGEDVSIADVAEIVGDGTQTCEPDDDSVQGAIEFREMIGLAAEPEAVSASFASATHMCTAFGVPLTALEADALVRFLNAQAELSDLAEELARDADFGGAYLDGTTLVVHSTTGRLGDGIKPSRGSISVRQAAVPFAELEATAEEITESVRDGSSARAGMDITLVAVDPRTNTVRVGVADDVDEARAALEERYDGLVTLERLIPSPAEHLCTKDECGTKGGLTIKKPGVTCTSGFLVKARKNNGPWSHYMLTAGHCIHNSGGIDSTNSWKNGTGTITWGRSKGLSFWEYECEGWTTCWDNDLGLFSLGGNLPAKKNQYFVGSGTAVPITGSKTKANQLIGQTVFRYGITSGLDSGEISSKSNVHAWSCWPRTCKTFNVVEVSHGSDYGDSGAGYYRLYTQDGAKRDAYGVVSVGPPGGSKTYYYAWNEYFDDYSNDVCDVWQVQPCTTGACAFL
jgi:hypothetical protein